MSTALKLEGVSVARLSDISFSVEAGTCVALLGEGSSGINCVSAMLTGTLPFVAGEVWLRDTQLSTASSRERKRTLAAVRVISASEGLGHLLKAVDDAVEHAADVVILDDPFRHLSSAQMVSAVAAVRKAIEKSTLGWLLLTSDAAAVNAVSDSVVVVYESEVVESGSVDQVIHSAQHPYTQALVSAVPQLDPISQAERELVILHSESEPVRGGCVLVSRCPFAHLQCEQLVPELLADDNGHQVACHYPQTRNVIISTTRRPHALRPMPSGSRAHEQVRPDIPGPITGRDFVSD